MRIFSYGGGVQSVAVLVLSAQGKLPYTHFIFANVGEDTENPETIEYTKNFAIPFAEKHGLFIIEIKREVSDTSRDTLYKDLMTTERSVSIPMYLGGAPVRRGCTSTWKISVVEKFMRDYVGAKKKRKKPIGIGISLDEFKRMRKFDEDRVTVVEYPLIDLRLTREDCEDIIQQAGLPKVPKSSCWFCPYKKISEWAKMEKTNPELFKKALALEEKLKNKISSEKSLTLHSKGLDLKDAVDQYNARVSKIPGYKEENDPENCESGYCMV